MDRQFDVSPNPLTTVHRQTSGERDHHVPAPISHRCRRNCLAPAMPLAAMGHSLWREDVVLMKLVAVRRSLLPPLWPTRAARRRRSQMQSDACPDESRPGQGEDVVDTASTSGRLSGQTPPALRLSALLILHYALSICRV